MESKRSKYEKQRASLVIDRQSWIADWQELGEYILPRRGRFLLTDRNRGGRRSQKIIDCTATAAVRTLSAGLMSGVTNPSRPWFRLAPPDPALARISSVKRWLYECETLLRNVFVKSNLYNALPNLYLDIGCFGTAAMGVLEDEQDVIRCYPFPIGSYYLSNNHRLTVDTFVREFSMTVRQLIERFGEDRVSSRVKTMWSNGQTEAWVDVVHMVRPNPEFDAQRLHSRYKRYASCYYEMAADGDKVLSESGFDEFPILCPRWHTDGEDVYGIGPALDVIGDVKALQTYEKRTAQAVEKKVNPPLVGPSSLRQSPVSMLPGGVTYLDEREGQKGLRPLHQVDFQIQEAEMKAQGCRQRIDRACFVDLFRMIANDERSNVTATEIMQRQEEKMQQIGPVLERLDDELLGPLIDRTFSIMQRRRMIPPPPPEMAGMEIKVEYISIMAQAQRMQGIAGVDRFLGTVGNLAQADPHVFDKVNRDKAVDFYADALGVPPDLVNSDDDVAAVRQQKAAAIQQQQQAAQVEQVAKGAQLLSKTDTRGDNALADIIRSSFGTAA
jgi:hypothetical protein